MEEEMSICSSNYHLQIHKWKKAKEEKEKTETKKE